MGKIKMLGLPSEDEDIEHLRLECFQADGVFREIGMNTSDLILVRELSIQANSIYRVFLGCVKRGGEVCLYRCKK